MLESASSANRCKRDSTLEPAEVEQVGPIGRRSEYDPFLMVRLRPMPGLVLSLNGEASLLLSRLAPCCQMGSRLLSGSLVAERRPAPHGAMWELERESVIARAGTAATFASRKLLVAIRARHLRPMASLAVMEYKGPELVRRFGAKIKNEHPVYAKEPLPEPIEAKLWTLVDIDRQRAAPLDKK